MSTPLKIYFCIFAPGVDEDPLDFKHFVTGSRDRLKELVEAEHFSRGRKGVPEMIRQSGVGIVTETGERVVVNRYIA